MLKAVLQHFYELADEARAKFGNDAPVVTDAIIQAAFPKTYAEAMEEGCDRMFRIGVKDAVKSYIRQPPQDDRQRHLNDIDPKFLPLIHDLGSVAYFVPSINGTGEYVGIPDLIAEPEKLDAARKFMRLKGDECLREAKKLDELYDAVVEK